MKNLDLLIPQDRPVSDSWRWATVTAAAPLRIRLDGDSDPLDLTPDCLFASPAVGQRVWVQLAGKRVIVIAPAGGSQAIGAAGVKVSNDPPASPVVGQLWFDSDDPGEVTLTAVPGLSAAKTGSQTLTAGASVVVTYNSLGNAAGGMTLDPASGMVIVPRDGWYQINGNVAFQASVSSARRIVGIATALPGSGGSGWSARTGTIVASAQDTANISSLPASGAFYLTAGSYAGLWANAGANWGIETSQSYMTTLSVVWMGY